MKRTKCTIADLKPFDLIEIESILYTRIDKRTKVFEHKSKEDMTGKILVFISYNGTFDKICVMYKNKMFGAYSGKNFPCIKIQE